ncbi:MAG: SDR family oxidoreductase [Lachnospiraceae bacterium]|jgi:NAD(P)-dependent dehydrogenase (short-subunit alcohol dehydrogenase family)|nr:SDR family oxidoreductase [Lachnospiraceae bacterium]
MYDYIQMEGKHVLITGGASGIGRQTAIILSEMGAKVSIMDLQEEGLKETLSMLKGEGHSIHAVDLSKIEELEDIVVGIIKETGPFDGYVQCAGIVKNLPIINYKFERLHKIMLVNFYSFFEIVRILSKKGRYNEGLSIVGISSIAATHGATAQAAYGASKAAMDGAMRCMAKELGEKKIRVNTIQPAATATAMYTEYMELKATMKETEMKIQANPRQFLGMNAPADVANAIIFLLSPVSHTITGVHLPVDGGFACC